MKSITSLFISSLLAAGTTTCFLSCSQNDEVSGTEDDANRISFAVTSDGAKRQRATATTPQNLNEQVKSFKLWSYNTGDGNYYIGKAGESGVFIDGDGKGGWNYRTATETAYWPINALNFYAVTPAEHTGYTFDANGRLTFVVPADQAEQIDLMVAKADNQTKTTNGGTVSLPFKHLLSQVAFKVKAGHEKMTVEVKSITLHNIQNTLTTTLKGSTSDAVSGDYQNYAVGLAEAVTADGTTAVSATDANGVLLLAPQSVEKWADGTTTTAADEQHQGYLAVVCKIKQDGNYLVGSATDYGTTYVPFEAQWEAGKAYTYTLVFGGGKNADGTELLEPITFNVSTADWNATGDSETKSEGSKTQEDDKNKDNTQSETTGDYTFVDLGLSVEWATCNLGASKPSEAGEAKEGDAQQEDVINTFNLPSSYRLPKEAEVEELLNTKKCTWTWTTEDGVDGYRVSKKGDETKSIFLPVDPQMDDSYTYYWSSYYVTDGKNYKFLRIRNDKHDYEVDGRTIKACVRLVKDK